MKRVVLVWSCIAFYATVGKADVPVHSDIALPRPDFAETDLGSPRNPPHRLNPMLWTIPTGVLFVLAAMVLVRRRSDSHHDN